MRGQNTQNTREKKKKHEREAERATHTSTPTQTHTHAHTDTNTHAPPVGVIVWDGELGGHGAHKHVTREALLPHVQDADVLEHRKRWQRVHLGHVNTCVCMFVYIS